MASVPGQKQEKLQRPTDRIKKEEKLGGSFACGHGRGVGPAVAGLLVPPRQGLVSLLTGCRAAPSLQLPRNRRTAALRVGIRERKKSSALITWASTAPQRAAPSHSCGGRHWPQRHRAGRSRFQTSGARPEMEEPQTTAPCLAASEATSPRLSLARASPYRLDFRN